MQASFYDYTGDNRVIDKQLGQTPLASLQTVTPYRPLSDLTGQITLTYNQTIFAANYCILTYGSGQNTYTKNYFITDRVLEAGGKMTLYLRCDVLTTFATAVKVLRVCCRRTAIADLQGQYLADEKAPVETRREVCQREDATELAHLSSSYILVTVG